MISIDINQLVWSMINFAILFFLLRKFFWKSILNIMATREREIAANLEQAENAREVAVQMKEEYERHLAEAQHRAEEMIGRAMRKAEDLSAEVKEKAQAEAGTILERAQEAIQREREQAMIQLRDQVAQIALEVASKVIQRSINDADHERLAKEFLAEMGEPR